MVKKLIFDTSNEVWKEVLDFKASHKLENTNATVETLVERALAEEKKIQAAFIPQERNLKLGIETSSQVGEFYLNVKTLEWNLKRPLIILLDAKTNAFYTECHILAEDLIKLADIDAAIDPEYQEEFRANRELRPNDLDFLVMKEDAKNGRQFSDLVIEYNETYREAIPLKVLGGQHRIEAIREALKSKVNRYHGIRVYFNLNKDQRVEIARISNTNINVSPDLRDRLEEQRLDPPNNLRNWSHLIGILEKGKDFGDRKTLKEFVPTVRMLRTFIVNFYKGKAYDGNPDKEPVVPDIAKTAGMDEEYLKIFKRVRSFIDEKDLTGAGKMFTFLHMMQIQKSKDIGEETSAFKLRAINLALISSWAFAAGALQKNKKRLDKLYELPRLSGAKDPLNALDMAKAHHPKLDSDTYRGLGTRTDAKERGRLLQLFLLYSNSEKKNITLEMCNTAILKYHALEATEEYEKHEKTAF